MLACEAPVSAWPRGTHSDVPRAAELHMRHMAGHAYRAKCMPTYVQV